MKIALGIVAILLSVAILVQSFAAAAYTGLSNQASTSHTGSQAAVGVFVALLFVIGGALSFALPRWAMFVFGAAFWFGILGAMNGGRFADLYIWAVVAGVFAAGAFWADYIGQPIGSIGGRRILDREPKVVMPPQVEEPSKELLQVH